VPSCRWPSPGLLPADVRHLLEDHAVALAVKGLDLHHQLGHYFLVV
jgi:hypothetical protein